jgi:hypothetical protein
MLAIGLGSRNRHVLWYAANHSHPRLRFGLVRLMRRGLSRAQAVPTMGQRQAAPASRTMEVPLDH